MPHHAITVFAAYGHTGRFVVTELLDRGHVPILAGRDAEKLARLGAEHPGLDIRVASVDSPAMLDAALDGAAAVINCAGPFAESAPALIDAASRAGVHYLDVTGESLVALETFEKYEDRARDAGIVVVPAMGFFGGLGDLLATAAMGDWPSADEIAVAVALDSWQPTRGTRLAGERRAGRRVVFSGGLLQNRTDSDPLPMSTWDFPPPVGTQHVIGEFSTVDVVTISRHLCTPQISTYINLAPLKDLRDPSTSGPVAADESGRSAQTFIVEVAARRAGEERRVSAHGRDIYAITAPIVVEAVERILDGRCRPTGIGTAGQLFDAEDFLQALPLNGR